MGYVQSLGSLVTLEAGWWPSGSYGALRLYDRYDHTYAEIYRTQPNVRVCVDFLARNIAQLGLHIYRRVSETDRERLRDHPLAMLLGRPNPWTTTYRLIEALVGDLGIYHNAYWLKVRGEGGRIALLRVPPHLVQVHSGLVPTGYTIALGTRSITVRPDGMVHYRGYNPDSAGEGLSPLETLRRVLAEEHAAGEYRENLWQNAARMAGIIERPADAGDWSETARERFRAEFEALYSGAQNSGRTAILEEGMQWKQVSFSPRDAEYLAGRKLTREECARAYHIPLPMVGILDHATFSNIKEQHKNLYQDSLGPWLAMIEQEIALQLLPEFADSEGVYVEFNIAEKLQGSFEEQTTALQSAVGRPWMTANEARARMNLPSVPEGDRLVTPLNVLTGGQASPRDSAPPKTVTVGLDWCSKALDDRTSVWMGMYLPAEEAEELAIEDGEPPEALHMTLVYLGQQPDDVRQSLPGLIEEWAANAPSLRATVSGLGRFTTDEGGGTEAFYASVDAPGLPEWRQNLVELLKANKITVDMTHGFTPHITLAYVDAEAQNPVDEVPELSWLFDKLTMSFGDLRRDYLLSSDVKARRRPSRKAAEEGAGGGGGAEEGAVDASLPATRARHETKWREVLEAFFSRQGRVMASRLGGLGLAPTLDAVWRDGARWDRELAADLYALYVATATVWARYVAGLLEAEIAEELLYDYLSEASRIMAENVNAVTRAQVEAALGADDFEGAVAGVFETAVGVRAPELATTAVTRAASFGSQEAARQGGFTRKTWVVNSTNPRSHHAAMAGETVGIRERFSNGMMWPGDPAGGADNNAGCQCSLRFSP